MNQTICDRDLEKAVMPRFYQMNLML